MTSIDAEGAPSEGEEIENVKIKAFDDVDGPINDTPPKQAPAEVTDTPAPLPEEAEINPAVEGAIPYDMTPPTEGDNVSHIPDMGQRDDTTPDQDDPTAPDVDLRT